MMGYKILVYWQITEEQKQKIREIADKHGCTTCFVTNLEEAKAEAADADIMFGSNPEPLHKAKNLKWLCTHWAGVNHYLT